MFEHFARLSTLDESPLKKPDTIHLTFSRNVISTSIRVMLFCCFFFGKFFSLENLKEEFYSVSAENI